MTIAVIIKWLVSDHRTISNVRNGTYFLSLPKCRRVSDLLPALNVQINFKIVTKQLESGSSGQFEWRPWPMDIKIVNKTYISCGARNSLLMSQKCWNMNNVLFIWRISIPTKHIDTYGCSRRLVIRISFTLNILNWIASH